MASFIKSIVKEVNIVKSMLDIPALKNEKESLTHKLEEAQKIYTKHQTILDKSTTIKETVTAMLDVCNLCLEGNAFELDKANTLNNALLDSIEKAQEGSDRAFAEIKRIESEIEKINGKLSAARAAVR